MEQNFRIYMGSSLGTELHSQQNVVPILVAVLKIMVLNKNFTVWGIF